MEYIDIDKVLPKWEDYFPRSFPPMKEEPPTLYIVKENTDESNAAGKNLGA